MAGFFTTFVEEMDGLLVVGFNIYRVLSKKRRGLKTYYRTEKGSILVEPGARFTKVWFEENIPCVEDGIIYRLLRKADESVFQAHGMIVPKNYFGEYTAEGHVLHGCRPGFTGSRFLSTSREMSGIQSYVQSLVQRGKREGQNPEHLVESLAVVVVDVARLMEQSIPCINAPFCMRGKMSKHYARAFQEVLVDGEIPLDCIRDLRFLSL